MPRWSKQELYDYQVRRQASSAKPQPIVRAESVAAPQRKEGDSTRVHVRVTSFRRRLIDPDNLCAKYFVDCCKYAGLIPDDSAEHITVETRQIKVVSKTTERTEITIEPIL